MKYKEQKRERRIRDRLRMIKKAYNAAKVKHFPIPFWYSTWKNDINERHYADWDVVFKYRQDKAVREHDHMAVCSCYMCGNPRHKAYGKERYTMQEKRQDISTKEQLEHLGDEG